MFFVAALFFLGQNYTTLKAGGFAFKHQDILLMPYYEPFLWGFYYLTIERFIAEEPGSTTLEWRAFGGLLLTALVFSLFSGSSISLLCTSLLSTTVLLIMFHERFDLYYAVSALTLGFVVEFFGVTSGLWTYPEPDFLGIPYWFTTMWLSVGILGRRLLIPLAKWLDNKLPPKTHRHHTAL